MREGPPGLDDVLRAVERRYGVTSEELRSACRARRLMVPRQVAMYLARRLLGLSLAEVGRQFGGRDHATVLYSERKVQKDMDGCLELRMAVDELSSELKG
jgi:chromosomal replication initiator protein